MIYFAVFPGGEVSRCGSLAEAINVPQKKWIIKCEAYTQHTTSFDNTYRYYEFQIINEKGERDYIKAGDCTCVEFGKEIRYWGADCTINPKVIDSNGELIELEYNTTSKNGIYILKKLLKDMEEISKYGGKFGWLLMIENRKLKKNYKSLEDENLILKERIKELESKIIDTTDCKE